MIDYAKFLNDPPVNLEVGNWLDGKSVLVTGGGGSIGSEICRKLLEYPVKNVVAIGRSEEPLFRLKNKSPDSRLVVNIADIQDQRTVSRYSPDIVFHTAAYKHVGLMENHVAEAVQNNIFGTVKLFSILHEAHFVFVSTDKAVFPTSVMGASKRFCEKYLTSRRNMGANVDIVRLGNVIGSSGSVAEIFEKAAKESKTLVVSSPHMHRFFVTPSNAAALIIQAGALQARASYVLKMGIEVSILDLARYIKSECGSTSSIVIGEPLPVEKVTEDLFDRPATEVSGKRLFRFEEETFDSGEIDTAIDSLEWAGMDAIRLRENLFKAVR